MPSRHQIAGPVAARFAAALCVLGLAAMLSAPLARAASDAPVDFEFIPIAPTPLAPAQLGPARPVPKFQFMFGAAARWRGPLVWKYNHANAPGPWDGDPAGTVAAITSTLTRWTQVCGIRFEYRGETTVPPDTRVQSPQYGEQPDYETVVGWGSFPDNTAGVTYAWYGVTNLGERLLYDTDIILSVDRVRSTQAMNRTATHEWGHALGLAHSNVGDAIMSGPPDTAYNGLLDLQPDDVRGCRCLYGPAAGQTAGYSCSLPKKIDFGIVPLNSKSAPQTIAFTNDGNAAITVGGALLGTPELAKDAGCAAGTVLQPGQSCAVQFSAWGTIVGTRAIDVAFDTSDGRYRVPVTFEVTDAPAPVVSVVTVLEYFHAGFGHYFVTYLPDEIAKLDNGTFAGWARTGKSWKAWAQPGTGTAPVCRFFSEAFAPRSSHFYTSFDFECADVKANKDWKFEGEVFHVQLPAPANGACPAGLAPVYRLYNESRDGVPNHRFTIDPAVQRQMIAQGWTAEGYGSGVTMCVPQ
jgi:hypothetical protein